MAAQSDRLRDTVDYGAVAELVCRIGTGESVHLVETLADRMATAVLAEFPLAGVTLTLRKLAPPIAGAPRAVGVSITRRPLV